MLGDAGESVMLMLRNYRDCEQPRRQAQRLSPL
jgi:hypothetical protein